MKIVLADGCFDVFHVGHLFYLKQAAKLGDILIVGVTCDDSVRLQKGERRPVFDEHKRLEMLTSLKIVHRALIVKDATDALQRIMPNVFVKGPDYRGHIQPKHERFCREHNIEIRFTDGPTWSSSQLLRHYES